MSELHNNFYTGDGHFNSPPKACKGFYKNASVYAFYLFSFLFKSLLLQLSVFHQHFYLDSIQICF